LTDDARVIALRFKVSGHSGAGYLLGPAVNFHKPLRRVRP
jgi:hypothetical protein